jgi:hypothetical protein
MNKLMRNSFGLAQIPIMIGLLLMAVAVPAVTSLVQQNQENRGKAMEVECTTDLQCGNGYKCQANSCKWVGFPTVRPTSKPTDKPSTGGSTDKPAYCSNWNAQNCEYGCTASSSGGSCKSAPTTTVVGDKVYMVGTCMNNYGTNACIPVRTVVNSNSPVPHNNCGACGGNNNPAPTAIPTTVPTVTPIITTQTCLVGTCITDGTSVGEVRHCVNIPQTVSINSSCPNHNCSTCGGNNNPAPTARPTTIPTATTSTSVTRTPTPIGTVQPINTPVSTSAPVADSCGRGWSCTSKSGGTACINAGGEIDSCKKSNGATGNCCIPNGGGQPVATNTPGSGGGNPPATNPTTVSGGGGNNNGGGGGGTTTTGCTECSKTFKCYSNGTEFKWFVDGFAMTGFNKVTTGTNVTTCNGVAKPTFLGKSKGDANCDGVININDYSLWHTEFYSGDAGSVVKKTWNADFTGPNGKCDGKVDIRDFSLWHSNFNN